MAKNENFLNYILSLGFIFSIIIILSLVIFISNIALTDENLIKEHVIVTKNLLQDIEKVEEVTQGNQNKSEVFVEDNSDFIDMYESKSLNLKIRDYSYLNINETKSFLTLNIPREINETNTSIYFKISSLEEINKFDIIVYNNSNQGIFISQDKNDDSLLIFDIKEEKRKNIDLSEINGKVIFIIN